MDTTPTLDPSVKYKRIVLKLSGEVLRNETTGEAIDGQVLQTVAEEVKLLVELGVEVCLVVGGGNIFRGISGADQGVDRSVGDTMGMLATVINGLAIMDTLERMQVPVRVMSAIPMEKVAEPFIQRRAIRHLEKKRVCVFVAGTGNPYFSTDSTVALRGNEVGADIIFKATKVDGIYDKDPMKFADAVKYDRLTFHECIVRDLKVMDQTAFSLCAQNNLPILVFSMYESGALLRAVRGEPIGTLVTGSLED